MKVKAEKIAGIIQKEVSEIIQFELKDPKIGFIDDYRCHGNK